MTDKQQQWQTLAIEFAQKINDYVDRGSREGWDSVGEQPEAPQLDDALPALLDALRSANQGSVRQDIKAQWPISYEMLHSLLNDNGQNIPMLCALPDGSLLARLGAIYAPGRVLHIQGDTVTELADIEFFGLCPQRRFYAFANLQGITVTDGWQGPQVASFPWPQGIEDIPEGIAVLPLANPPKPTQLIPFPDGKRVLLVSSNGIFVLSQNGTRRLFPTREHLEQLVLDEDFAEEGLTIGLSMEHGAISPDGKLIAIGVQDGPHLVFNDALECIAQVGPHGEYPHYALFSADGRYLAMNACHFYNGATISMPIEKLPGIDSDYYEDIDGLTIIEPGARVYAGVSRGDEFILGDAYGYVRAVTADGQSLWQHFIGSTVEAIDISADGKTLFVSTCAGFISIIELDAGQQQPYQIGNGNHYEHRRWLFWKGEDAPLAW
ncbi:Uncharacterised protein [Leminorella richardii]|uniref:Uncharacterized protein n=1 Tax=Leminorella richardii TaxID=158841 RepID=A0A2X4U554_9GAMM|nr:hypothetical protein [Leminorella richardii]SQI34313.1 Uncharacterised protein [Leminorella richardii]